MIGDEYRALMDWADATGYYRVGLAAHGGHLCKLLVYDNQHDVVAWATIHQRSLDEAAREVVERLTALA